MMVFVIVSKDDALSYEDTVRSAMDDGQYIAYAVDNDEVLKLEVEASMVGLANIHASRSRRYDCFTLGAPR